jgi:hypothetical protein
MSTIIADNLTGKTAAGNVTVTSEGGAATFQLQQGLIKTWANYDADAATPTIEDSFNVASLSDIGLGRVDVNYSNNMGNATFAVQATPEYDYGGSNAIIVHGDQSATMSTTKNRVVGVLANLSNYGEADHFYVQIAGDLA